MKRVKWLSVFVTFLFTVFLFACTPTEEIDFDAIFDAAQAEINLSENVTEDVDLPTSMTVNGLTIGVSWTSSQPTVISVSGDVIRPTFETGNISVILTATFTYLEQTHTHPFTVIVQALPIEIFVVTYYSKGAVYQTSSVDKGSLLTSPSNPTPLAYETFGGWYKEEAFVNPWLFTEYTVDETVNLYAKWNAVPQYTVSFVPGNGEDITTQQVYQGDKVTAITAPTKVGYTFLSWVLEDETVWSFSTNVVTAPVTLFATYNIINYTITYVMPDGVTVSDPGQATYNYETPVNDLTAVSKEYADFVGWFDAMEGGNLVTGYQAGTKTGHITLYARFTDHIPFTVTFDDPKGEDVIQSRYEGQYALPIADPIHAGYTFLGWFKNLADSEPYGFAEQILSNVTLTAKYALIDYAITYQVGGGTHANPSLFNIETPTITLQSATKDHYSFAGWFDALEGGNQVMSIPLGSTGHKTLYARYNAVLYTIAYELDGGELQGSNLVNYTLVTEIFTFSEPTKEGYQFIGWYNANVGGEKIESITLGSSGNITLYARYSELLNINYYAYIDVEIKQLIVSEDLPQTHLALSSDYKLYTSGDNTYGLLGQGLVSASDQWVNITPRFNLTLDESIVSVSLVGRQALVHTSLGRVFIWGLLSHDGIETYLYEPKDISDYSAHAEDEITKLMPHYNFFIFETSEGLFVFRNAVVTEITPSIQVGETLKWAFLYGFGESPSPLAFSTATSIYLFDPYTAFNFVNIKTSLNLPDEDIIAIMAQDFAIHVITETRYIFATFTGNSEMPLFVIDIPVTIPVEADEIAQEIFGGGAILTNQNRVFIPYYIFGESEEMPEQVIYADITHKLNLEVGETIVKIQAPFFIETSTGRILIVIMEENETIDPLNLPLPDAMDLEIDNYLESGEIFEGFEFNQYQIYFRSNMRYATVVFGQNGLILENLSFKAVGLVHRDLAARYMIEDHLFIPEVPEYQAFVGWYLDENYTTLFDESLAADGLNLYAKFAFTHYFITFELYNNETIPMIAVEIDSVPVEPEAPIKPHSDFLEWYYFDDMGYHSYDFSYALNQDVMLYASYLTKQYDVTFVYEGFDNIVTKQQALTSYDDLLISVPNGYEVIAVYMDQDKLIPLDLEGELTHDVTLYVAIDPITVHITYYNDLEDINFIEIYPSGNQAYGVTADGRIFGWGSNYLGALGIGYEHMQDFPMPYDMTHLFDFGLGESIWMFSSYYNIKTVLSSENRIFVWGYYDDEGIIQSVVKEITSSIPILNTQTVVHIQTNSSGIYYFMNDGTIKYYQFSDETVKTISTGLTFTKIILAQQNYDTNGLFIIAKDGIYEIKVNTETQSVEVNNLAYALEGDEVFYTKMSNQTYGQHYIYTKEGRIYRVDMYTLEFELVTDFVLNLGEKLENAFIVAWDTMAFTTNQGRLIGYNTAKFIIDVSILNEGEKLLTYEYGYQFFTSLGRTLYLNTGTQELYNPLDQFVLNGETIIRYLTINWILYAEYSNHTFWQSGGTEFDETIGIVPVVELYQYGETFLLATPIEKPGYTFHGWVDIYGNLYTEVPSNDILLFPFWTLSN